MQSQARIQVATDLTRDAITAEVWIGNDLWAVLVEYDDGRPLMLELHPRQDGRPWSLAMDEAVDLLTRARARLQLPATGSHSAAEL